MRFVNNKLIQGTLLLAAFALLMSSCLMDDDLMTADAKTGGLVEASQLVQLIPKASDNVEIELKAYQGPAIQSVKVYKQFYHYATGESSDLLLLGSIGINGENYSDTLLLNQTFTWQQLKAGIVLQNYTLPEDPLNADVGDYFTLKYVSVLDDGREVTSNSQTEVLIANSYAGYYLSDITFFHPNFGTYPDQPYRHLQLIKELITADGSTCYTNFALWGSYGETIYLTVNSDNTISFEVFGFDYIVKEGDPNNPLLYSHYDPLTDKIYLYYHYEGPGGNRIFWEVLEPYSKK
jgi:hypothetical protein